MHAVINTNNAGSCIVYDGVDAGGTVMAAIDLAKVLGALEFNAPFSVGLTVVSLGASVITVTYE